MKLLTVLCALTCSTLALADDKSDVQNCERTKAYVLARKDLCIEEASALQALDCSNKQARSRVDLAGLNSTCQKKKRPPKAGGTEHEET